VFMSNATHLIRGMWERRELTSDGYRIYRIPRQYMADLEKKVAKINKVADKLDKPLVSLYKFDQYDTVKYTGRRGYRSSYTAEYVGVRGETPVLDGWRFLAVVLHSRTGNEFKQVPQEFTHITDKQSTELSEFVYRDKQCDHCNKQRPRNATYLVRHDDTGEIKQVGSTCLGDFTGFHSPHAAAKACENIFKLFRTIAEYDKAPRTTKTFILEDWMMFVAAEIAENGWRSRKEYGSDSTADCAKVKIIQWADDPNFPTPDEKYREQATEVIEWGRNVDTTDNDFLTGMQACMVDEINEDDMGRTAAAFLSYERATGPDMVAILTS